MDIFDPINRSQTLLTQLPAAISHDNKAEIQVLISALENQLALIKSNTSTLQQQLTQLNKSSATKTSSIASKPEMKSACYVFAGEKGFFCPRCYDNHNTKVATTRLNSKLRICPVCKMSIK